MKWRILGNKSVPRVRRCAWSGGHLALRDASLTVEAASSSRHGAIGSGKTTLLNLLAAIDTPTSGRSRSTGQTYQGFPTRPGGVPPPQSGLHLPGLQPLAHPLGAGKRGVAVGVGGLSPKVILSRLHEVAQQWASSPSVQASLPVVGWRTAAHGHRAGHHPPPVPHSGRRAHRQPGLQVIGKRDEGAI